MFSLIGKEPDGDVKVDARHGYDGNVIVTYVSDWATTERDKSQDDAWDLYRTLLGRGYVEA